MNEAAAILQLVIQAGWTVYQVHEALENAGANVPTREELEAQFAAFEALEIKGG